MPTTINRENPVWVPTGEAAFLWRVETSAYTALMAGSLDAGVSGGILWTITDRAGRILAYAPEAIGYVDHMGYFDPIVPLGAVLAQADGDSLTFDHPGYLVHYQALPDRLKLTITLRAPLRAPDPARVTVETAMLTLTGGLLIPSELEIRDVDGNIQTGDWSTAAEVWLWDPARNEPVQYLDRMKAIDASGNHGHGELRIVVDEDGARRLYMGVPWSWLKVAKYPVEIDPTVVTTSTSATATAYSNQRKTVRCSNGNVVDFWAEGTTIKYAVSLDGGQTFGTAQTAVSDSALALARGFSVDIATNSNAIFLVVGTYSGSYNCKLYVGGTGNQTTWTFSLGGTYSNETSEFGYPDVVVEWDGTNYYVHCVVSFLWNGHSVWYRRWVFNASLTYVSETQTTLYSWTSGTAHTYPTISRDSNRHLYVTWTTGTTGAGRGVRFKKATYSSGSWTWGSEEAVDENNYASSGYINSTLDDSGRLLVAYKKSSDNYLSVKERASNGTITDRTPSNVSANALSITHDGDGNGYVAYVSSGCFYRKWTMSGASWGGAVTVDSSANTNHPTWRRGYAGASLDLMYVDGAGSPYSVKHHRVTLNTAPTAPTNLSPNATGRDATAALTLTATAHDDAGDYPTDAMWELTDGTTTWYALADGTLTTTPTWVPTGGGSFELSIALDAGVLTNGETIQWRVKTKDQGALESPWSDMAQFTTTLAPVTSIVSPTTGATISSAQITAEISVSGSFGSATYRLYADNAGAPGALLKEHSGVTGTRKTFEYTPANATTYHVAALAVSTDGVVGAEVSVPVTTSFTVAAKPVITAIPMGDQYPPHVALSVTNPAPTGSEPTVTSNRIERSSDNGVTWVAHSTTTANGSTNDYSPASDTIYLYRAVAIGDNGTERVGDPAAAGISRECWWFVPISDPSQAIPFAWNREANWQHDMEFTEVGTRGPATVHFFGGRKRFVANISALYVAPELGTPHDAVTLTKEEWRERFVSLVGVQGYLCSPDGLVKKGILEPPQGQFVRDLVANPTTVSCRFVEKGGA